MGIRRRASRFPGGGLAFACAGAIVAAAAVTPAFGSARGPTARLRWHDCDGGFQCATLAVPLDDAAVGGRTIELAVVRKPARDRAARIGSLVVNPGGPGAPADAYLREVADSLPGAVQDRFDLVSFDPRGVGASSPVDCVHTLDPLFDQPFSPSTPAQQAALDAAVTSLADACRARDPTLLLHVSTAETAHDLDRLRVALGERRLSFLGFSYGTYLGALYESTFPARVRAFVLDGAVDPTLSAEASVLQEVRGFEHSLDDFLADCSTKTRCAFHHDGHAARAYDALRSRAARSPLAVADSSRRLDQTRFDAAVLDALYDGTAEWPTLARALRDADHGDASTLLELADSLVGRGPAGADDNMLEAFWAISCRDGPVVGGLAAAQRIAAEAAAIAPRLGAFIVNFSLPCSVWPVAALPAPGTLTGAPTGSPPTGALPTGAPKTLVIGTTQDPATPLVDGQAVASALHGALLVVRGNRHTAFLSGNPCVDRVVSRYLVSLVAPDRDTRC